LFVCLLTIVFVIDEKSHTIIAYVDVISNNIYIGNPWTRSVLVPRSRVTSAGYAYNFANESLSITKEFRRNLKDYY